MRRLGLGAAFGFALLLLISASGARAATITIVNPSGVGQAGTQINQHPSGSFQYADGYGQATRTLVPGEQYRVTRDPNGPVTGCPPPEGTGVIYTVPNPAPANATIVVPSSSGPANEPWRSSTERGIVGLINQARAENGLGPLEISATLSAAADGYSNFMALSGAFSHCSLGSPRSRATDAGYPTEPAGVAENLATAASAHEAFEQWMGSSPHRTNMLNPAYSIVGIGRVGSLWTLMLARPCTSACERAGLTGDYGDPSLADGRPNDDGGPGSECIGLTGKALKKCKAKAIKRCKKKKSPKKRKRCIRQVKAIGRQPA